MNKVYFEISGGHYNARWENGDGDRLFKTCYEKSEVYGWAKRIGASKVIEVTF
jgi:hypothetical protein